MGFRHIVDEEEALAPVRAVQAPGAQQHPPRVHGQLRQLVDEQVVADAPAILGGGERVREPGEGGGAVRLPLRAELLDRHAGRLGDQREPLVAVLDGVVDGEHRAGVERGL